MKSTHPYYAFPLLAALALLPAAPADESAAPTSAIESPEIAQELAISARRFIDALDPSMQAKYLFQDAEREYFQFFQIARIGFPL
jgi:hypothetical protein